MPETGPALVEPGVVNIELSEAAAEYGLYYAPDPSSQRACTIGGNVAENAGGPHCLAYGVTTNHVLGMEVVLPDGEIAWLGSDLRESVGFDLRGAFIGSEGTLGIATKVSVRLLKTPETVRTMLAAFPSLDSASQAVSDIIASGIVPSALEMMDRNTIDACEPVYHPGYPADAQAVLIVELDGLLETVDDEARKVEDVCSDCGASEFRRADDPASRAELWATRKGAIGGHGHARAELLPRRRRSPPDSTLRGARPRYGHRSGNGTYDRQRVPRRGRQPAPLHSFRRTRPRPGPAGHRVRPHRILELCVESGGALSGEHGIGIEKQAYMPLVFTDADIEAMSRLRPAFGAGDSFNPGKVFPGGAVHGETFGVEAIAVGRTGTADVV